jgi:hypothetical protein
VIDATGQWIGGWHLVGVPPFRGIHRYKFVWSKFQIKDGVKIEYGATMHDPELIYITPFESQFAFPFQEVEVRGERRNTDGAQIIVPVGFELTFRTRMLRPKIALMRDHGDWFSGVLIPMLQAELKDFVGAYTYEVLVGEGKSRVSKEFFDYIMTDGTGPSRFRQNLLRDAGVDLLHVAITAIDPNKEYEQANLDLAKAEKKAEEARATAAGAADAARTLADSTLYAEKQRAQGIVAVGVAEAERETVLRNATGIYYPERMKWEGLKNVRVYAPGGNDKGTSILIGTEDQN